MNTLVEGDVLPQPAPMGAQRQAAGPRVSSRRRTEASIPPHATAAASASGWTQKTLATLDAPAGAPQRRADDIVVARNSSSNSNVQPQQSSMASPSAGRHHNELRLELVSSPREGSTSSSSTQPAQQPAVAAPGAGAGGRRSHRTRGTGGGGGDGGQQQEGGPLTFAGAFPFARNQSATNAEAAVNRDLVAGQPPAPPQQQAHAQSQHTQRKFSAEHSVRVPSVIRVEVLLLTKYFPV